MLWQQAKRLQWPVIFAAQGEICTGMLFDAVAQAVNIPDEGMLGSFGAPF